MAKKIQVSQTQQTATAEKAEDHELYAVSAYLKDLKFAPRVMGVDEADVWKKIEKLCELYETALAEERGKNEKLTKQLKACAVKLKKLLPAQKKEGEKPNG